MAERPSIAVTSNEKRYSTPSTVANNTPEGTVADFADAMVRGAWVAMSIHGDPDASEHDHSYDNAELDESGSKHIVASAESEMP